MEEGNHTMMEKIYAPMDVRPIGGHYGGSGL